MAALHLTSSSSLMNGGLSSTSTSMAPSRNIERIFEEAQYTGELCLAGRNMKEFCSSGKYNLIDTTKADISRNRLGELPGHVCQFIFMEQLNCRENVLRSLPDDFSHLRCLVQLDLSRNAISSFPVILCGLPLQILLITHNRLAALPDEIGQMRCLTELDASCNEISHVSNQLGNLAKLRSLNLRKNKLHNIPNEISKLLLCRLDLSENRITSLPPSFRLMHGLEKLEIGANPLEHPPAQVCSRGQIHVFKSLERASNQKPKEDVSRKDSAPTVVLPFKVPKEPVPVSNPNPLRNGWPPKDKEKTPEFLSNGDGPSAPLHVTPHQIINQCLPLNTKESQPFVPSLPLNSQPKIPLPAAIVSPPDKSPVKDAVVVEAPPVNLALPLVAVAPLKNGHLDSSPPENASTNCAVIRPPGTLCDAKDGVKKAPVLSQIPRKISPTNVSHSMPRGTKALASPVRNGSRTPTSALVPKTIIASHTVVAQQEFKSRHGIIKTQQREAAERALQEMERLDSSTVTTATSASMKPPARRLSSDSKTKPTVNGGSHHRATSGQGSHTTVSKTESHNSSKEFNPNFTIRRQQEQIKEEAEKLTMLRKYLETRLKLELPEDLLGALQDGVMLCHLVNHIRPRSVISIHVPSTMTQAGQLKLTSAKCRRNVENFLDACRRLGVADVLMCSPTDILEGKNAARIFECVHNLTQLETAAASRRHHPVQSVGGLRSTSVPSAVPVNAPSTVRDSSVV